MLFPQANSRRHPSSPLAAFLVLPILCCLGASITHGAQQAPASPAFMTSVLGSTAQQQSVVVTLRWAETTADDEPMELSLLDRDGAVVASRWIYANPGATTSEELPDALVGATQRAQHHEIRLTDGQGEPVVENFPLQVGLACSSPSTCEFALYNGISAPHMLFLTPSMAAALAEAKAAAAPDPLVHVAQNHPDLWGDIYAMGWQLATMDGDTNAESSADCQCLWTLEADHLSLDFDQDPDVDDTKDNSCGGTHSKSYRRLGQNTPQTTSGLGGSSKLTPAISCWVTSPGESQPIEVLPGQFIEVPGVEVANCGSECPGDVAFSASYSLDMATITNTLGDGASIFDAVAFSVGNHQVFSDIFGLQSHGGTDRKGSATKNGSWPGTDGETAELTSGTLIRLDYALLTLPGNGNSSPQLQCRDAQSTQDPCAEGITEGSYRIDLNASSQCTTGPLNNRAFATFVPQPLVEGTVTDDINLLVGKCDG